MPAKDSLEKVRKGTSERVSQLSPQRRALLDALVQKQKASQAKPKEEDTMANTSSQNPKGSPPWGSQNQGDNSIPGTGAPNPWSFFGDFMKQFSASPQQGMPNPMNWMHQFVPTFPDVNGPQGFGWPNQAWPNQAWPSPQSSAPFWGSDPSPFHPPQDSSQQNQTKAGEPYSPVVGLKPKGKKNPLFCIHAIMGSVFFYHKLAMHMGDDQPVYGLQARGLSPNEEPLTTISEMAASYIKAIRKIQPKGPYQVCGYSFGGWIAYEIARQFAKQGQKDTRLFLLDVAVPLSVSQPAQVEYINHCLSYMEDQQKLMTNSNLAEQFNLGAAPPPQPPPLDQPPMAKVIQANERASFRYMPRPFGGGAFLFVTADQYASFPHDITLGWRKLCVGDIEPIALEGNHLSIFEEPHVAGLAKKMTEALT